MTTERARARDLSMAGRNLQPSDAKELEKTLESNEEELDARIKLIGFHHGRHIWDRAHRESLVRHVTWFIKNHPEHEFLSLPESSLFGMPVDEASILVACSDLWEGQISNNRQNGHVLVNGANFFSLKNRPRELELLQCVFA